ncbi:MAG TPA: DnaJ domain-containing protein, partial [Anaerolineae bacterium]|nr:DnaJ domain-containing protein [Anaerolineae bacterium]
MKNYYQILQVVPQAEPEVIEAAYRRLMRKYHPDVLALGEQGSVQAVR